LTFESWLRMVTTLIVLAAAVLPAHAITGKEKAWAMFEAAAKSNSTTDRAIGIRALGLLREDLHARALAESALDDDKPEVRIAAATALGQMHATESVPKLQKLLSNEKVGVVMAAAHSLRTLKDNTSAYAVYYDILTGARKGQGMLAQQLDTLRNPREMAKIGLEEGIGYIPFAGIGWDAWRYTHKKDPNPVRAVAASFLAHDPDPATGVALSDAMKDKDWIVRAAAIEALAERGDPAVEGKIEFKLFDANAHVRYTAAAAVIRLSEINDRKQAANRGDTNLSSANSK
jgi:HEAT repeat protein